MIEPIERASPREPSSVPSRTYAASGGTSVALPGGHIAGHLRLLPRSHAGRTPYELLVSNDTASPLTAFTYALALPGSQSTAPQRWNAVVVPPFSAVALTLEFPAGPREHESRVVARLQSEQAQLTFDAPPPKRRAPRGRRRSAAVAAGLLLVGTALAFAAAGRPHVLALGGPDSVPAAMPFSVAYALAGARTATYAVRAADGTLVDSGSLPPSSGAFSVALPPTAVSEGYDIRVVAAGPFGTDSRSAHVVAMPAEPVAPQRTVAARPRAVPAQSAARIAGLTIAHDTVHGGQPIFVDYRTSARSGMVRLIDQQGTVRAEALLSRTGRSILVAPYTDVDQDVRVTVTAQLGEAHDEAAVPVRVLRMLPPATAGSASANEPSAQDGTSPIAVDPMSDAGKPIVVRILRHDPGLHVALVDATGTELFAADVPPGAQTVSLPAPHGTKSGPLSVIASFSRGFGQETVIRSVTPRLKPNS